MNALRYALCTAPGCTSTGQSRIRSVHRTRETAIRQANCSDRLCVIDVSGTSWRKGDVVEIGQWTIDYIIPRQNDPLLGEGRYGRGLRFR